MTPSEFKYTIPLVGNTAKGVLINYNTYPGGVYKIDEVAVRIVGNLEQLQLATSISISALEGAGEPIIILVDNSSSPVRVVDRQIVGDYYLYNILTESQRVVIENPSAFSGSLHVVIEPSAGFSNQAIQDYSATLGTVLTSRESNYIVHSDRLYATPLSKTNPANLYSIISNTAVPAQVQDSSYSSTGWINGRYNGSKLTSLGNHGIDPCIQGTFFEGAFFGKDVDDLYISEIAPSDLDFGQYFFSGKLDSLRYTLEDINTITSIGYNNYTVDMYFRNDVTGLNPSKNIPPLSIGELFRVDSVGPFPGLSSEILQMIPPIATQQYFPYNSYTSSLTETYFNMRVKRGYAETPIDSAVQYSSALYRIVPTRVYNLQGNFAQSVTEGKMRVRGTTEVLYLDNSGLVISGSTTDYI